VSNVIGRGADTLLHGFPDHPHTASVSCGLIELRDEDLRLLSILRRWAVESLDSQ
jgi:hypothetical protein